MGLALDFTKFNSPIKVHDNVTVIDVGSGTYPRYIEIRMTGTDGARRTAIWDGMLDLANNDKVICHEYPGNPVLRVVGFGGDQSASVDSIRVSKVWQSDVGAVALQSDASGNIGIGNATPQKLLHVGAGADAPIVANDGIYASNAGATSVIVRNSTENIENFLHTSTTAGVLGTVTNHNLEVRTNNATRITIDTSGNVGVGASPTYFFDLTNATTNWRMRLNGTGTDSVVSLEMANDAQRYLFTVDGSASDIFKIRDATGAADRLILNTSGELGVNVTPAGAQLHVDQSSTTAAKPVMLLDQGDVDEPFIKFIGTAAAATLTRSIVDEGDVTTPTRIGWAKIEIDDVGNQVTDGDYFVPFYTLA